MRGTMMTKRKDSAEKVIRDIRRATRRQYSAEEKIRIVLEGLRENLQAYSLPLLNEDELMTIRVL